MGKSVTLLVPAQVVDIRPRADKSVKLSFETQELPGEEAAMLFDYLQGTGWLSFAPNEQELPSLPDKNAEPGTKSRSQRLRNTMYAVWKSNGSKGSFESYVENQMERLIELYKSKIVQE